MDSHGDRPKVSPFKQPKAVWVVAFACVVSFMGIGLVDPILKTLAAQLQATPSQVELLFTSYLVITAIAMLVTGWVSSRIGAKWTLVAGLALIVCFAAAAGSVNSISGIVGFRAGWGLGNALFIATSLAVIVSSASGGFGGAIILYETALGVGIAIGPLLGGVLGEVSWRGPFYGVSILMGIALIGTVFMLPRPPKPVRKQKLSEPIRALKHRALATTSVVGLLYNWAFFTVLGYSPFLMGIDSPIKLGLVFCGWGLLLAIFAIFGAPMLQRRFGTPRVLYGNLLLMACVVGTIALFPYDHTVVIVAAIVSGIFCGVNNTLVTTAVMSIAPVERPVASATYGFVRFIGGGLAPWIAGILVNHFGAHLPFAIGAGALVVAAVVLSTVHGALTAADRGQVIQPELDALERAMDADPFPEAETVGSAS
jgi:MFS family permease